MVRCLSWVILLPSFQQTFTEYILNIRHFARYQMLQRKLQKNKVPTLKELTLGWRMRYSVGERQEIRNFKTV